MSPANVANMPLTARKNRLPANTANFIVELSLDIIH